jgi:hypothetical protein
MVLLGQRQLAARSGSQQHQFQSSRDGAGAGGARRRLAGAGSGVASQRDEDPQADSRSDSEQIALGADRLMTLVEIVEPKLPHGIPPLGRSSRHNESDFLGVRQCYFSRCP